MGRRKKAGSTTSKEKEREQAKKNAPAVFVRTDFAKLLRGKANEGPSASIEDVMNIEENRRVIFKLVYTSILMLLVPIGTYFALDAMLPRMFPLMHPETALLISMLTSLGMVLLISILYVIAAFKED